MRLSCPGHVLALTMLIGSASLAGCGDSTGSSAGGGAEGGGAEGGAGGAGGAPIAGPGVKPACTGEPSGSGTPDARADAAMAAAPDGLSAVMFGGDVATVVCGQTPAREHVDETWVLDVACGGWARIEGAAPEARSRHVMATDEAAGRAILFGGRTRSGSSGPYTLFNDVWAFDFATQTWSEITTTGTAPTARFNSGAVVVDGKLYVFGGSDEPDGLSFAPRDDLFVLDLATGAWQELTAGTSPPARLFHAMTADPVAGKLFVYGGGDEAAFTGPFFSDAWEYDIASALWSEITASVGAITDPGRIKLGLLAQPVEGGTALTMFAGHDDGALGNRNDVATLDAGASAWQLAIEGDAYANPANGQCDFPADFVTVDEASPERRSSFAFTPVSGGNAFIVFGGDSDCGRLSDTWWYDAVHGTWTPIRATLVGLICPRTGSTTCDSLCG